MNFVHDDPEFSDIIDAVAAEGPIASGAMVEKDYWICHSLWALSRSGLRFWFKGGTSLSKAFNLIERFSEDIDLVVADFCDGRRSVSTLELLAMAEGGPS